MSEYDNVVVSDALEFIERSLDELLPDDPAQTTSADLTLLASLHQGSAKLVLDLHKHTRELAARAEDRADSAEVRELGALAAESATVAALEERAGIADRRLDDYTRRAFEAKGISIDEA